MLDPDAVKFYTNYSLKKRIREGVDFLLVPGTVWHYWQSIYGGKEIKRLVIDGHVELYLPRVEIRWRRGDGWVQLCSLETVAGLKRKLQRILKFHGDSKLWKMNEEEWERISAEFQTAGSNDEWVINGNLLENEQRVVEEVKSGEVVVVELYEDAYRIKLARDSLEQCENCGSRGRLYWCECRQVKYCGADC